MRPIRRDRPKDRLLYQTITSWFNFSIVQTRTHGRYSLTVPREPPSIRTYVSCMSPNRSVISKSSSAYGSRPCPHFRHFAQGVSQNQNREDVTIKSNPASCDHASRRQPRSSFPWFAVQGNTQKARRRRPTNGCTDVVLIVIVIIEPKVN